MQTDWMIRAGEICRSCGARCCIGACPPLSDERIRIILSNGDFTDRIERNGYRRIRTKENDECSMLEDGRCVIHGFKPETCAAGPFTFDVGDHAIRIFLKKENLCPIVPHLKASREIYRVQYERALDNISRLVASLPEDELRIISSIDEPDTELVATIPLRQVVRP
jgi:uncharacterized protein